MAYYLIKEQLTPCQREEAVRKEYQFTAVLKPEEYREKAESFHMGIDIGIDTGNIHETKAIVNYDSLTGSFNIPDHESYGESKFKIAFVLDETGIIFIDSGDYVERTLENIRHTKKWKFPSMERLIYDFLEETIKYDAGLIENVEKDLNNIELEIMSGKIESYPKQLNDIRSGLLDMHMHYEHLIDVAKEFEENENEFFQQENLRYFRLFSERVQRLQDNVTQQREYIIQLRDLVSEQLSIKQNNIMTLLTVVTTIFMPLTLIAGWYGMNFVNMPELHWPYGYPVIIVVSLMIVAGALLYFKKKKWL